MNTTSVTATLQRLNELYSHLADLMKGPRDNEDYERQHERIGKKMDECLARLGMSHEEALSRILRISPEIAAIAMGKEPSTPRRKKVSLAKLLKLQERQHLERDELLKLYANDPLVKALIESSADKQDLVRKISDLMGQALGLPPEE